MCIELRGQPYVVVVRVISVKGVAQHISTRLAGGNRGHVASLRLHCHNEKHFVMRKLFKWRGGQMGGKIILHVLTANRYYAKLKTYFESKHILDFGNKNAI